MFKYFSWLTVNLVYRKQFSEPLVPLKISFTWYLYLFARNAFIVLAVKMSPAKTLLFKHSQSIHFLNYCFKTIVNKVEGWLSMAIQLLILVPTFAAKCGHDPPCPPSLLSSGKSHVRVTLNSSSFPELVSKSKSPCSMCLMHVHCTLSKLLICKIKRKCVKIRSLGLSRFIILACFYLMAIPNI